MNRGKWRDMIEPQQLAVTDATLPRSNQWIAYGRGDYLRRCVDLPAGEGCGVWPPGAPLYIGQPPPPSQQIVARGKEVWQNAKCWECHGNTGKGDGEKAPGLKDDFGFPSRPADLTSGQFKSGPAVGDIFRTMSTGFSGTPMPSYRDSLPEQDRWALAYYVVSLSSFQEPSTGEPCPCSARGPPALSDPKLEGATPR